MVLLGNPTKQRTKERQLVASCPVLPKNPLQTDTHLRKAIAPGLKLAITLHHLAEGASHASISAHYRLGRSTTSQLFIIQLMLCGKCFIQPIYLKPPSGPTVVDGFCDYASSER